MALGFRIAMVLRLVGAMLTITIVSSFANGLVDHDTTCFRGTMRQIFGVALLIVDRVAFGDPLGHWNCFVILFAPLTFGYLFFVRHVHGNRFANLVVMGLMTFLYVCGLTMGDIIIATRASAIIVFLENTLDALDNILFEVKKLV